MNAEIAIERLTTILLSGDRAAARSYALSLRQGGTTCEEVAQEVFWPIVALLHQHRRSDAITTLAFNYATRLLRSIVDGWRAGYAQSERNGGTLLFYSGDAEVEEMGAQLAADLAEAAGWRVQFAGGNLATDEVINETGRVNPTALVCWAPLGSDVPSVRGLIEELRTRGAFPEMPVICGGGIFCRAQGLGEQIGADAIASTPGDLIRVLHEIDRAKVRANRTNAPLPTNAARRDRIERRRAAA